jgi:hypothetical protein
LLLLLEGSWDNQIAPKVIVGVAELGFDLIEIPVQNPDEFDSVLIGKLLSENNLEGVGSLALPKNLHAPANPKGRLQSSGSCLEFIGTTTNFPPLPLSAPVGRISLMGCRQSSKKIP